jgi:DNA-binding transcriptional MerR regulator
MDEEDDVRQPDAVRTSRLYDFDHEDDVEERISQLMETGLSLEEATQIADDQNQETSNRKRNMAMENKVEIMNEIF